MIAKIQKAGFILFVASIIIGAILLLWSILTRDAYILLASFFILLVVAPAAVYIMEYEPKQKTL